MNRWMVGLTLLWVIVFGVAIVLAVLGAATRSLTYDRVGLPPSKVFAGIYYACSGVALAVALVLVGVQLAVEAPR